MDFLYSAVYSFGNHVLVEWLCKQDEPDVLGYVAVVFLMAAGAGTVGVISWMGYMKRIEMEHRALKNSRNSWDCTEKPLMNRFKEWKKIKKSSITK